MEELEEEDQLALADDGGVVVPLGVYAPAWRVDGPRSGGVFVGVSWLTRRVGINRRGSGIHATEIVSLAEIWRDLHFLF